MPMRNQMRNLLLLEMARIENQVLPYYPEYETLPDRFISFWGILGRLTFH